MNPSEDHERSDVERRREQVRVELRRAGLEIIDDEGWRAVSIRSVGARSHYARGTISYHLPNFESFHTDLWQIVGRALAASMFQSAGVDEPDSSGSRAGKVATQVLEWARAHPQRARFFVEYVPLTDRPLQAAPHPDVDPWPVGGPVSAEMHFLIRKFQAALEFVLRVPHDPSARAHFTHEVASLQTSWSRAVREPGPDDSTTPPLDTPEV